MPRIKSVPSPVPAAPEYLSLAQIAERYGVGVPTLRQWIRDHRLPAVYVGDRLVRVDRHVFEAVMLRPVSTLDAS